MQFQVPQFIETEDKVVGPLSLRQFGFVAGAGILSAILFFIAQTWLWVIGSILLFSVATSLAFLKIEGRSFTNIVISAFNFYWKPQTYVWKPETKVAHVSEKSVMAEASGSGLESILGKSIAKNRPAIVYAAPTISRQAISSGAALHKTWETVQTGSAFDGKKSDRQFLENKMEERYQIFQKPSGERRVAKRIDYR